MVRRILICATCSQRFISAKNSHVHCSSCYSNSSIIINNGCITSPRDAEVWSSLRAADYSHHPSTSSITFHTVITSSSANAAAAAASTIQPESHHQTAQQQPQQSARENDSPLLDQKPAAATDDSVNPQKGLYVESTTTTASNALVAVTDESIADEASAPAVARCDDFAAEPLLSSKLYRSASTSMSTEPVVVIDLYGDYDDDEDDDDFDKPLVNLLHRSGAEDLKPSNPDELRHRSDTAAPVLFEDFLPKTTEPAAVAGECIELLSDDEEEEDEQDGFSEADADEPVLADFEPEQQPPARYDNALVPKEFQRAFQDEQAQLHTTAGLVASSNSSSHGGISTTTNPVDPTNNSNTDLSVCFVCGASLTDIKAGYKGRLNHIKRCSKKHGVTAKDVRLDDDYEMFTTSNKPVKTSASNPYLKKNDWHSCAGEDLAIIGEGKKLPAAAAAAAPTANQMLMLAGINHAAAAKPLSAAPSVNQILMAGARRAAKTAHIQVQAKSNGKKRQRFNSTFTSYSSSTTCPSFKKIPGTDFCCDGFQYANSATTKNYFLTHFHADHYGGITKTWNAGTIYCSLPTANLVHEQLGVDRQYLHPLPMLIPTVLESSNGSAVTVTLLNANHCPGAIMYLFEVGKRVILHVGDFRWNYGIMSSQAPLRPFCRIPWSGRNCDRRIDDLFLDTTYCDAQYSLPTQEECIQATVEVAVQEVQRAQSSKSRILMLFGAYTIGKEAVYLSVAKKLGLRVYVDKRRYKILSALEWPKEGLSILTTKPEDTIIWVVPLGHINMKKMVAYKSIRMQGFSRDFDRVVGFRPTGWSLSSKKDQSSVVGTTSKGSLTVHSVPYSEHSSFPELVECLESLNPKRIIPTVSVSKSQQQIDLLLTHWRDKQSKLL